MAEERVHHKRTFLNAEDGMAALEASVSNHSWTNKEDGKHFTNIDGGLCITDCSRSISLNFSVNDAESLAKAVQKANRLLHAIEDLRDALVKTAKREGIKHR